MSNTHTNANDKPLWIPRSESIAASHMTAFARAVHSRYCVNVDSYASLHAWSIDHLDDFWNAVWDYTRVIADTKGARGLIDEDKMPGAQFFPDAKINFAENLLRRRDATDAIVFWGENKIKRRLSHCDLYNQVARTSQAMRTHGVQAGDRIAGFMPNMPETVIAALAAATIGAVWTSCSADFGLQGVLDRFGQVEPTILFAADGYFGAGKVIPTLDTVRAIAANLPSVKYVVIVPYVDEHPSIDNIAHAVLWADWLQATTPNAPGEIIFTSLPFNHPLYIMYSSGTTGVPKCIVHSAGGTLLMHLKEHQLHGDIKSGDRVFYYTTCGWMMWNWLITALASDATLLLYDGSPFVNRGSILFDFADEEGMTHFGVSAKFLDALAKLNVAPIKTYPLEKLRMMLSTGSPLAPEGFDYVYTQIKRDLCLSSISGGTDLIALFAGGAMTLPVYRGELQCLQLGMAVAVFNEAGKSVRGEKGELVCTRPFPTMPLYFWNDPDNKRYHQAYFERFPDVWHHGDYCEITVHDGLIIYGRSDAVLNPGGVRIGTAEIYRQVEALDEIEESIVIGQDWPPERSGSVRMVLFVRLRAGELLTDQLIKKIKKHIRINTTPHHVPAKILQVTDIPRTRNGKIVELAVRNVVHHEAVRNREALANPEALTLFENRLELQN